MIGFQHSQYFITPFPLMIFFFSRLALIAFCTQPSLLQLHWLRIYLIPSGYIITLPSLYKQFSENLQLKSSLLKTNFMIVHPYEINTFYSKTSGGLCQTSQHNIFTASLIRIRFSLSKTWSAEAFWYKNPLSSSPQWLPKTECSVLVYKILKCNCCFFLLFKVLLFCLLSFRLKLMSHELCIASQCCNGKLCKILLCRTRNIFPKALNLSQKC